MKVSIIVPLYNEEENVEYLIEQTSEALSTYPDWEIIAVDDGSTDNTPKQLKHKASQTNNIKVISFTKNRGQGNALKAGFNVAEGEIVVTMDADMSYDPADIPNLLNVMQEDETIDIVVGSPYKRGGKVVGVPFLRAMLSKGANKLIGLALPGNLRTVTGIFKAYRQPILRSLELESNGKEIHFEILSKALAIGANITEVPATLKSRKSGVSKTKIGTAVISHLLFSFFERPAILFEIIGLVMLLLGLSSGIYIIILWQEQALDPTRPLMILMVLLIIVGALVLSFGFIASQITRLRKEIYQVQKENLQLKQNLAQKDQKTDL